MVAEHPLQRQTADALPLELARPAKCCVIVWCGVLHYLWRAVDRHGVVLHILVQAAAKRFFKQMLRGMRYKPRRVITDGSPQL